METFTDALAFLAGTPSLVGPLLAATVLVLASNWRWSLMALLLQYAFVALALTHYVRTEVAIIKAVVGGLVVILLFFSAERIPVARSSANDVQRGWRRLRFQVGWLGGPLGMPLRLLAVLLMALALIQLFANYSLTLVPVEIAFVACWLGGMGMLGLVLSGDPLRVASSLLTILTGFDLVYSGLEPSLTMVGFWAAFTLVAALAFSYLAAVYGLALGGTESEGAEL